MHMASVPCKFFNEGKGTCSFGTSCFYAHMNPDGTVWKPPPLRRVLDDEHYTRVVRDVQLGDFIKPARRAR